MEFCIPHFGKTSILNQALVSIFKTDSQASIYVADDTHALTMDALGLSPRKQKQVHIFSGTNAGYAAQANYLISKTKGAWVVLMNNDVTLSEGWWPAQRQYLAGISKRTAMVASLLVLPNGLVDSQGDSFSSFGVGFKRTHLLPVNTVSTVPVTSVSGALMLLNKWAWKDLGGFDEQIGTYFEDVDFGLRAIAAGWKVLYNREAQAQHQESASTPGQYKESQTIKNSFLVVKKNFAPKLRQALLLRLRLWWLAHILLNPSRGRLISEAIRQGLQTQIEQKGAGLSQLPKRKLLGFLGESLLLRRNYRFTSRFW